MKFIFNVFIVAVLIAVGYEVQDERPYESSKTIAAAGKTANYPEMTQDFKGNIVAWWVETNPESGEEMVYFSRSQLAKLSFTESRPVPATRNVNAGAGTYP